MTKKPLSPSTVVNNIDQSKSLESKRPHIDTDSDLKAERILNKRKKRISYDVLPKQSVTFKPIPISNVAEQGDNILGDTAKTSLNVQNESKTDANQITNTDSDNNSNSNTLRQTVSDLLSLISNKINFFVGEKVTVSPIEVINVELCVSLFKMFGN